MSDENGDSHFQDENIPLENAGTIGFLSVQKTVSAVVFREVEGSYDYNFHTAPHRQYIILNY